MSAPVFGRFCAGRSLGSLDRSAHDRVRARLFQSFGALPPGPELNSSPSTRGIFNLEFSPDGSMLGVACEERCVVLMDPVNRRPVGSVPEAHRDCVNCIRFLDDRLFATCSDDTTVALWDARNLSARLRLLKGHTNWVKNIEFSRRENRLVTSGFDGAVYTWDINRYSDESGPAAQPEFSKAFYTNGLMRMRLTPNWDKMVLSTMNGYIMVIHDLCLETMQQDLDDFKPNMYRIMQMSGKLLPAAVKYTPLFHAKRNRVQLISDFPDEDEAEVISSLQIHPQGWVAASRNISSDDSSEWCCVHDIQAYPTMEDEDELIDGKTRTFQQSVLRTRERRTRQEAARLRTARAQGGPNGGGDGDDPFMIGEVFGGSRGGMARLAEFITLSNVSSAQADSGEMQQQRGLAVQTRGGRPLTLTPAFSLSGGSAARILNTMEDDVSMSSASSDSDSGDEDEEEDQDDDEDDSRRQPRQAARSGAAAPLQRSRNDGRRLLDLLSLLSSYSRQQPGALVGDGGASAPRNAGEDRRVPPSRASDWALRVRAGGDLAGDRRLQGSGGNSATFRSRSPLRFRAQLLSEGRSPGLSDDSSSNSQSPNSSPRTGRRGEGIILLPPEGPGNPGSIFYFGGLGSRDRRDGGGSTGGGASSGGDSDQQSSKGPSGVPVGSSSSSEAAAAAASRDPEGFRLHGNRDRLVYYLEEMNQGRAFIKEIAFSPDGRVIASPYGNGVRLLGFDRSCQEMPYCMSKVPGVGDSQEEDWPEPSRLAEVAKVAGLPSAGPDDFALSCAFHPHNMSLAVGCYSGKLSWLQPLL